MSKKLGELLIENNLVSEQQLLAALAIQETNKRLLGSILIEQGYITKEKLESILARQAGSKLGEILIENMVINFIQLKRALDMQRAELRPLSDILVDIGYATEDNLLEALAKQYHLARINLSQYNINPLAFPKVPAEVLKRYNVLPIDIKDGFLVVATSDPENVMAVSDLSFVSGMHIKLVLASKKEIQSLLE